MKDLPYQRINLTVMSGGTALNNKSNVYHTLSRKLKVSLSSIRNEQKCCQLNIINQFSYLDLKRFFTHLTESPLIGLIVKVVSLDTVCDTIAVDKMILIWREPHTNSHYFSCHSSKILDQMIFDQSDQTCCARLNLKRQSLFSTIIPFSHCFIRSSIRSTIILLLISLLLSAYSKSRFKSLKISAYISNGSVSRCSSANASNTKTSSSSSTGLLVFGGFGYDMMPWELLIGSLFINYF